MQVCLTPYQMRLWGYDPPKDGEIFYIFEISKTKVINTKEITYKPRELVLPNSLVVYRQFVNAKEFYKCVDLHRKNIIKSS